MKGLLKRILEKKGFTIVELLTVMAIMALLLGILVPALNMVRNQAKEVKQRAQTHSIEVALEMYKNKMGDYPPSNWYDGDPAASPPIAYNGAMKLAEAMVGMDLLGQHIDSVFTLDGNDLDNNPLYPNDPCDDNLAARVGPFVKLENANAYKLKHIYNKTKLDAINVIWAERYVLCDVFGTVRNIGQGPRTIGMPILYYKADTRKTGHDANDLVRNIYDWADNAALLNLGVPPDGDVNHPLLGTGSTPSDYAKPFYNMTRNENITTISKPYNEDSFFLISAGIDGRYGTPDDIFNISK
ncbi:MAG: prepilin-type N-terminal cleavage/methylation domain-containing protein [Planctomycetota bacterium]